jgi:hypothetical protein
MGYFLVTHVLTEKTRMKIIFFTFLIVVSFFKTSFSHSSAEQEMNSIKFNIIQAYRNGVDITSITTEQNQFLLYEFDENTQGKMFYNIAIKDESYSFGKIINADYYFIYNEDGDKVYVIEFLWDFLNSYNSKSGTADVAIRFIISEDGTGEFYTTIESEYGYLQYYGECGVIKKIKSIF